MRLQCLEEIYICARFAEELPFRWGETSEDDLAKHFSNNEIQEIRESEHPEKVFAGKIAAKEAVKKSVRKPDGPDFNLSDVEIRRSASGKPRAVLYGDGLKISRENGIISFQISISHNDHWTVASAIAIADPA